MDSNAHDETNRDPAGLSSPEYRSKLLTKLNCLIAVLEVAIAKIARTIDSPGADTERLAKIRGNLENTLLICNRAKQTLERSRNIESPASDAARPRARARQRMSYRDYVELSSIDEYKKFKSLPPISTSDLARVDFDDLVRKLNET